MDFDIQTRRREILLLLLTAIALALFVNLIANVVFAALYEKHKLLFTVLVLIATALVAIGSYLSFLTQAEKSRVSIQFPLTFNRRDMKFVDLPHCPPSVHARVLFDKLPAEVRGRFAKQDSNWRDFFRGDFSRFIDDVVQEILLTLLLPRLREEKAGWKAVAKHELPEGISDNPCMSKEFERNSPVYRLFFPQWLRLETFGKNNRNIRFLSEFGNAQLVWTVSWGQMAHLTEPFMTLTGMKPGVDYHDFTVHITLSYDCKFSKILSRRLNDYVEWVQDLERSLKRLDWDEVEKRLPLELLKNLNRLLSQRANDSSNLETKQQR